MQFQKLRVSGFKSFVDATEFRIDPGLTGIVGPNGCGKSNLLEALRWVMGATSAKAMRGAGMDDVIFAGADKRPPRNWAEVTLTIDNGLRLAPHPFTDQPVLEVARRIDRGAGSTYRINGKEVRARDIQLLFADASTGANSPALVRQGQISELIAAKPQNRRRVLEEAGGVSGLHTRRHEAELRLRAAETNLGRLDDISRELDQALSRLKREARQADKFKKISAEIRSLQRAILHARWIEEKAQAEQVMTQLRDLSQKADDLARATAVAQTEALNAAEAIKPAREEEAIAATIVHRLNIEKERLDLEEKQIVSEIERLKGDLKRFLTDQEREAALTQDGTSQIERLTAAIDTLEAEIKSAPSREPELIKRAETLDEERKTADQAIEKMAALQAALIERQRADDARLREAEMRLTRAREQLTATQTEKAGLGTFDQAALEAARDAVTNLTASLDQLRVDLEALEADRTQLAEAEVAARQAHRQLEDAQGRLNSEARGLAQVLSASSTKQKAPVLDQVRPEKGYELALAAALGDDLNLGLAHGNDPEVLAFWSEGFTGEATAPDFAAMGSVEPLSRFVTAPAALALRLKAIGVVADKATGDRLQSRLSSGARLVSREGDLWRWDGVIVRAKAPKPAAVRLSQRTRLDELEAEIAAKAPELTALQARATEARRQVAEIENDLKTLRPKRPELEKTLRSEQQKLEEMQRLEARFEARMSALEETLKQRLEAVTEAETHATATRDAMQAPADTSALEADLARARAEAEQKRQAAAAARAELEDERRDRAARDSRRSSLGREREDWVRRTQEARTRLEKLEADQTQVRDLLVKAESAPRGFEDKRLRLMDQLATAEKRLNEARDALNVAEGMRRDAEASERSLGTEAATAREHRASALARHEAQTQRQEELSALILEQTGADPDELGRKLKEEAIAAPSDSAGAQALLSGLERERDELGPVNLRAEEEATEYQTRLESISRERLDLTTAIAKLRDGIDELNAEGRERLLAAFDIINANFQRLFVSLFGGGEAELRLIESDDPLEAGLEIYACPPGKRLSSMSLMSGGEQALTATALIFGVFLANPAPVCVLDEVDAPLDDANVDRYCRLLDEMRKATHTRFIAITHNPVTMARMDRLFGVTMSERGVSQLVSVELSQAEAMVAEDA